ncbi:MAG: nitrile hydratase subunit beta [Alphaproteobacteria bacterium]|nr:nitrile hydratase subunit beta [Alphaproteobacteria bacterium]
MNGFHDIGGMHGFGPIDAQRNAAPYFDDWERRMFALDMACGTLDLGNLDQWRHTIERMPATAYSQASYYERWLHCLEALLVEAGVLNTEEIATRMAEIVASERVVVEEN